MAKAAKKTERKVSEETTVTLTLSVDEAVTLHTVLANIGGDREAGPRKHTDAVYKALNSAGINYYGSAAYRLHSGSMRFGTYPASHKGEAPNAEKGGVFGYGTLGGLSFGGVL